MRTLARWQIVLNLAFVGGGIWCLVLAASRSRHFPLSVMVLLGSAVVMSFAVVGISMAVLDDPARGPGLAVILRPILTCAIWMPYVIASRRVSNTFSPDRRSTA